MKKPEKKIEINRTQFKILRQKRPDIYSVASIKVEGRGPTLKVFLKPIGETNKELLDSILLGLFPGMKIPVS
ncbi:MAG: hypothetical protein WC468_01855 [Candidatus Paceibacterota bacterium]